MDIYASRTGQSERIVPRQDPIICRAGEPPAGYLPQYAADYEAYGYTLLTDMFSAREIEAFAAEAERIATDATVGRNRRAVLEPDDATLRSVFDVGRFSTLFSSLMQDDRLTGWARYILGEEVYVHQSRLNYKRGFEGESFYWHSDFETWHVEDGMPRMRALSMSIALADNQTTNGPVMVIPGSHRHYVACSGTTPERNHLRSLRRQEYGTPSTAAIRTLTATTTIVPVTCNAGDVLIFDCNTMHGSAANITPYPRTNLFVVYNARSNRLRKPYSGMKPRPEWIARRRTPARTAPSTDDDLRS